MIVKISNKLSDFNGSQGEIAYLVSLDFEMDANGNVIKGYIRAKLENGSMTRADKQVGNTEVTVKAA
jgi:hypothetical protein